MDERYDQMMNMGIVALLHTKVGGDRQPASQPASSKRGSKGTMNRLY